MKINTKGLNQAVHEIMAVCGDKPSNKLPGILMETIKDGVWVKYNDGDRCIAQFIEAEVKEEELDKSLAFNFERLVDIMSNCSEATCFAPELEIEFKGDLALVSAIKYIDIGIDEEGESILEQVSTSKYTTKIFNPSATMKTSILCKGEYEAAVKVNEDSDVWSTIELQNMFKQLIGDKSSTSYIAPNHKMAFVPDTRYNVVMPVEDKSTVFCGTANIVNCIANLLNEVKGKYDEVRVHNIAEKFIGINTEDGTFGAIIRMSKGMENHISATIQYMKKQYSQMQITCYSQPVKSILKEAVKACGEVAANIKFARDSEGKVGMVLRATNLSSNIDNAYNIVCVDCLTNGVNIDEIEVPVSLGALSEIVNKISSDFIAIDAAIDNSTITLRVSDVNIEEKVKLELEAKVPMVQEANEHMLTGTATEQEKEIASLDMENPLERRKLKLSLDKLIELREKYIGTKIFTISKRG